MERPAPVTAYFKTVKIVPLTASIVKHHLPCYTTAPHLTVALGCPRQARLQRSSTLSASIWIIATSCHQTAIGIRWVRGLSRCHNLDAKDLPLLSVEALRHICRANSRSWWPNPPRPSNINSWHSNPHITSHQQPLRPPKVVHSTTNKTS